MRIPLQAAAALAAACFAACAFARPAAAPFPNRSVTLTVGIAPGGGTSACATTGRRAK